MTVLRQVTKRSQSLEDERRGLRFVCEWPSECFPEAMTITKQLFVSLLALSLMGFLGAPLQAQNAAPSSGMDMKAMNAQMQQMRTQMDQMQTLMKDNMAKMAAADAAMKSHMETEQASMKSGMELQHSVINQLQTMTDHMLMMAHHMAMMPDSADMHKKGGAPAKKE
jgi:hypothetical protein